MDELFLHAARLSGLAYQDPVDIESEIIKTGFKDFDFIENEETDTQAFLCSMDDIAFLSFRGTTFDNWRDWLTNLNCRLVSCPFGRWHQGFGTDVESVYQEILSKLVKHIVHNRKLVIDGHSQGAGDANVMGIKMLAEHRYIHRVIQFGGPRTVDSVAANHIDTYFPGLFQRVVNNNDLVTRVPPRLSEYKHFGDLNYFLEDGELSMDISFWEQFLDRIHGKIEDFGEKYPDCLKDHMIDTEYIRLTEQAVLGKLAVL